LFYTFLEQPSADGFRELAESLFASAAYAPYSTDLRDIAVLCQQERYEDALAKSDSCLWGMILSPRLHVYRSLAFNKLGNVSAEQMEEVIFRACIEGIVGTGDGTRASPYLVTGISDEYDVIQSLKKRSVRQRLHQEGDRAFDVHLLDDGTELWFDITNVKQRIDAHFASRSS
jgi:hypothetical protein